MKYPNNFLKYIHMIENNNAEIYLKPRYEKAALFGINEPTYKNILCGNIPASLKVREKIIVKLRELLNDPSIIEADVFPNDINTPQGVK